MVFLGDHLKLLTVAFLQPTLQKVMLSFDKTQVQVLKLHQQFHLRKPKEMLFHLLAE